MATTTMATTIATMATVDTSPFCHAVPAAKNYAASETARALASAALSCAKHHKIGVERNPL